jgi:DNA invertase Pin-like site-specific DNA recombinase
MVDEKAVIYLRVSTESQSQDLKNQRNICFLEALRLVFKEMLFYQEIISGYEPLMQRFELMDALAQLKSGDVFIATDRDRIARDPSMLPDIITMITNAGATLICINERTSLDAFALLANDISSQRMLENTRSNTKKILKEKKKNNEVTGNIKRGYKLADDKIHLQKDLNENIIITRAKKLRLKGCTMREIAIDLNKSDLCNRSGNAFTAKQIQKILTPKETKQRNPKYGNTLMEQQMVQVIKKYYLADYPLRDITKMINDLGYRTRKGTELTLTQIARIIKSL